jgi:hypothetical protein
MIQISARRSIPAAALTLACLVPGMAPVAQTAPFQVQSAVVVRPDTVRVGEPFVVAVGIRAPAGATIVFPEPPDTTHVVQGVDPRHVRTGSDGAFVEQYADYRVAAWDVGRQPIVLADVVVRLGSAEHRIRLDGYSVFVGSVLPADTALRVPKPARALVAEPGIPWWLWALVAAAATAAAYALWRRLRRRHREPASSVVPIDPFARAEREFTRIESLRLVEAGEGGRYVSLMVEVVRDYLSARYLEADLSLTSGELLRALRQRDGVPRGRLERLLDEVDLIKFARRPVSRQQAIELGHEARAVVGEEHVAAARPPRESAA